MSIESALASIPNPVVWKDLNSVYQFASRVGANMIGLQLDQIQGVTDHTMPIGPNHLAERFVKEDASVIKAQKSQRYLEIHRGFGSELSINLSVKSPWLDESGSCIGTCCSLHDVRSIAMSALGQLVLSEVKKKEFDGVCLSSECDNPAGLSNRELDCLFCLIRGLTSKESANILFLSYRTVEGYVSNLKAKLGVFLKSDLIEKATELGYANYVPNWLFKEDIVLKL